MRAKAYFPKEKMNQIITFVQDSLGCGSRPRWEFLLKKIIGFSNFRGLGYREQHVRLKS
jgi:hypothetical protein